MPGRRYPTHVSQPAAVSVRPPRRHPRAGLAAVLRGALFCAGVAMALSVAWSYGELTDASDDDVVIANYELRADLMP